jgi:hypothetical protein
MSRWKAPIFALMLIGLMPAHPVLAEEAAPDILAVSPETTQPTTVDAARETPTDTPEVIDDNMMEKIKAMSPEERKEYFQKRFNRVKEMTPEEKEAYRKKRKEWFDSLPEEEKKAMRERLKSFREQSMKQRKDAFDSMSDEEKEAFMAKRKAEWQERLKNMSPEEKKEFERGKAFGEKMRERRLKEKEAAE